jgi:hypothetical protein
MREGFEQKRFLGEEISEGVGEKIGRLKHLLMEKRDKGVHFHYISPVVINLLPVVLLAASQRCSPKLFLLSSLFHTFLQDDYSFLLLFLLTQGGREREKDLHSHCTLWNERRQQEHGKKRKVLMREMLSVPE